MEDLLKLIQVLGKNTDSITTRQLSIDAKIPYTTTLRNINNNKQLFLITKKGNIKLITLNYNDDILKNYLILAERYVAEEFLIKYPELKILKSNLEKGNYSIILFGSRAEETNRKNSDVDLCIINKDGKKNISFAKFESLFKITVNPMFISKLEYEQMLKEKEHNLANEIIKKHILLYGEEYYWNIVWNNKNQ
jgi:predicted nucleotidyltransferase